MEKLSVAELDFSKLDGLICPLLVTITEKALEERRKFRKCPENQPDFGGL